MTEAQKIQVAFNQAFNEAADARRAAQEALYAANAVALNAQGEAKRYAIHVECLAQYALRQSCGAEYALLQAWGAWDQAR